MICYPYVAIENSGRGIDRYSYLLLSQMKEKQIDVSVVERGKLDRPWKIVVNETILAQKLFSTEADLFHAVSPIGAKTAVFIGRKPLVATIHDLIPFALFEWSPVKYRYLKFCIKVTAIKSDMIVVPFFSTKKDLVSIFNLSPKKIKVVNLGIDLTRFPSRLKVDSETKRILFFGGAHPIIRGGDVLVRAFHIVQKKLKNVELLIGGTGNDINVLRKLVYTLGEKQNVKFLGFVQEKDLAMYYATADVFIFPSRLGFGLAVLEAMACGIPVIVSDAPDLREFVGDNGIVVRTNAVDQLADAIMLILTNDKVNEELSEKAIERARFFSKERMVEGTLDVYNKMLGNTI